MEPVNETAEAPTPEQLAAELNSWRAEAQTMNRLLVRVLEVVETMEGSPLEAVRAYGADLRHLFETRRSS